MLAAFSAGWVGPGRPRCCHEICGWMEQLHALAWHPLSRQLPVLLQAVMTELYRRLKLYAYRV